MGVCLKKGMDSKSCGLIMMPSILVSRFYHNKQYPPWIAPTDHDCPMEDDEHILVIFGVTLGKPY